MNANADLVIQDLCQQIAKLSQDKAVLYAVSFQKEQEVQQLRHDMQVLEQEVNQLRQEVSQLRQDVNDSVEG